jgi:hypothetical protein
VDTPKAEHRILLVEAGARWARNILLELLSNEGSLLTEERRGLLRQAVMALGTFESARREPAHPEVVAAAAERDRLIGLPGHSFSRAPCAPCQARLGCRLAEPLR